MNIDFGKLGVRIYSNRCETVCPEYWANCFSPPKPIGSVQSSFYSCHHTTHAWLLKPSDMLPNAYRVPTSIGAQMKMRWEPTLVFVFSWVLSVSQKYWSRDELLHYKPSKLASVPGLQTRKEGRLGTYCTCICAHAPIPYNSVNQCADEKRGVNIQCLRFRGYVLARILWQYGYLTDT